MVVTITAASGAQETFRTTEEHPFRVQGDAWVTAGALSRGSVIEVLGGVGVVESVRFTPERATVYNIEVEDVHNYFVGAGGVLVHNGNPCKKVRHHVFPAFRDNPAKQRYFIDRNIDVDALTKEIDEVTHHRLHPQWNREWEEFMLNNPHATREEVFKQAANMLERWGIADAPTLPYGRPTR